MTYTTLDAALAALESVPATQEAILDFVHQLSVEVAGLDADAVTYLYAGRINGNSAWEIIKATDDDAALTSKRSLDKRSAVRGFNISGASRRKIHDRWTALRLSNHESRLRLLGE